MKGNYVLAHDLGTTGNKATLYDREGSLAGSAFFPYDTEYAHTGWAEQSPEDWWHAVCASTQALLAQTRVAGDDIACLVFSDQMMGSDASGMNLYDLERGCWSERILQAAQATYDRLYPVFEAAYQALVPICDRMADLP